jgi:predicted cobalt transporter CbtA
VAAVAYFALGAVWYLPAVLGKPWMRSLGRETMEGAGSAAIYAVPAVTSLVAAIATALLAAATGSDTFAEGLILGLVVGIGYAVTITGLDALYDPNKKEPLTWWWITAGYHLLGLVIVAVIVSIWR